MAKDSRDKRAERAGAVCAWPDSGVRSGRFGAAAGAELPNDRAGIAGIKRRFEAVRRTCRCRAAGKDMGNPEGMSVDHGRPVDLRSPRRKKARSGDDQVLLITVGVSGESAQGC